MAGVSGDIGGYGIDEWFQTGFVGSEEQSPSTQTPAPLTPDCIRPYLVTGRPVWLLLPAGEQKHSEQWVAAFAGEPVQIVFGRAGLALAMGAAGRLGQPCQLLAVDSNDAVQILSLTLQPSESGVSVLHSGVDGRFDGANDLATLLEKAQAAVPEIDVLVCPGFPQDRGFERVMPFLGSLSNWNRPGVRWEFPEHLLPTFGVPGALWALYWLLDGYRLGDWKGPGALLCLDENSPLAGIIAVGASAGPGTGTLPFKLRPGPVIEGRKTNEETGE